VFLALVSAATYGTADFFGGLATRRARVFVVVLTTQACGLAAVALAAPFLGGIWLGRDALIAAAGGLGGVLGLLCFYRSLAIGPMSIAAPFSAVLSALVPLTTGIALGERPGAAAWVGIVLAFVAVVLFSRHADTPAEPDAPPDALDEVPRTGAARPSLTANVLVLSTLAGLGFGSFFVALDKVSDDSGLWPIVSARAASAMVVAIVVFATRAPAALPRDVIPIAVIAGVFDTLANVFVLLANRYGELSIVSVLASLYPAGTVILALAFLHERFTRTHLGASLAALAAVVSIAFGSSTGADATASERQREVAARGAPVMGFDLDRTTHHFDATDFGGIQTVVANDPDDTAQIDLVRAHLQHEAARFAGGDFSDPGQIHGNDMPGLAVLEAAAADNGIEVEYEVVEHGARINYRSDEPIVIGAIHLWFAAQVHDHGTHVEMD
jgi:drug/metabolite transporter (DMT)-like permease